MKIPNLNFLIYPTLLNPIFYIGFLFSIIVIIFGNFNIKYKDGYKYLQFSKKELINNIKGSCEFYLLFFVNTFWMNKEKSKAFARYKCFSIFPYEPNSYQHKIDLARLRNRYLKFKK
jgi:hypothetical protein